jgi:hypothetical protein
MQLPGVTDAAEQPCQSPPVVSASGHAPATAPTFLLAPAVPAQQPQLFVSSS